MRKLVYHVASTLDGFIADADDGVAAFPHHGDYVASLRSYDTIVMGRRTYELGLREGRGRHHRGAGPACVAVAAPLACVDPTLTPR